MSRTMFELGGTSPAMGERLFEHYRDLEIAPTAFSDS